MQQRAAIRHQYFTGFVSTGMGATVVLRSDAPMSPICGRAS